MSGYQLYVLGFKSKLVAILWSCFPPSIPPIEMQKNRREEVL
jgi:hypothetical protein